tara:strand:- start:340 stop:1194 length:855 start_codon:yes stop_codon:yes gene_type:complete
LSRNRDRVGGESKSSPPNAPVEAINTNIFSFVAPTEFVELPSEGKFYPSEHPLFNQKTIEIKQMTAKEEDILSSMTLIKNGVALDRLLESIIIDKTIKPETLLLGDRNAIVIAARVSGYGIEYRTEIRCPKCEADQKFGFNLTQAKTRTTSQIVNSLDESINLIDNEFRISLPKSKLDVGLKLLNGIDESSISDKLEINEKQNLDKLVTTQLSFMISSVNGNQTREAIEHVVENLPSSDSAFIRKLYKSIIPNIDLTLNFKCSSCSYCQDMEVPLNVDFFWPDQ